MGFHLAFSSWNTMSVPPHDILLLDSLAMSSCYNGGGLCHSYDNVFSLYCVVGENPQYQRLTDQVQFYIPFQHIT